MNSLFFAIPAYAGGCFVLSALLVRALPGSSSAGLLRRNLAVFTIFPILLLVEIANGLVKLGWMAARVFGKVFAVLSGRPQMHRASLYYGYGLSSQHQRRKRTSPRSTSPSRRS